MMENGVYVDPDFGALELTAKLNPVPPDRSDFMPNAVDEGCEPSFPGLPKAFKEGETCPWLAAVQHSTRAFKWPSMFGHRESLHPPDEHMMMRWLRQDEEANNLLNDIVRAINGGTIWCARVDYQSGQLDPFKTRMLLCDAEALARIRQGPPAASEPEPAAPAAPVKPSKPRGKAGPRQDEEANNLLNDIVRAINGGTTWCARVDYQSGQLDPFKTRMLLCDAEALARIRHGPPAASEPEPQPEPAAPAAPVKPFKPRGKAGPKSTQPALLLDYDQLSPEDRSTNKRVLLAIIAKRNAEGRSIKGCTTDTLQRAKNARKATETAS